MAMCLAVLPQVQEEQDEVLEHVTCEDYLRMETYREAYWPPTNE